MFEPFNTSFPLIGADLSYGDDFCAVVRPNQTPICSCCTKEEHEDFLIGEYGAEKVLEVKKEEERREKELQKNESRR